MNEEQTQNEPLQPESITNGPILILLVAMLLAILGGMFYWFSTMNNTPVVVPATLRPTAEQNREPESEGARAQAEANTIVSTSDEIPAIEADIDSTNLDTLETELDAIEAELNNALQTE